MKGFLASIFILLLFGGVLVPGSTAKELLKSQISQNSLNGIPILVINEFTVDPQTDWDISGTVGTSDEWVELFNKGTAVVDLNGWTLEMVDTTPATETLEGSIVPGEHLVILNPTGVQNNDGKIELRDTDGNVLDSVTYGDFDDGNLGDNAVDGNAASIEDECLARNPDGIDTNIDSSDFAKGECTYGIENTPEPVAFSDIGVSFDGDVSADSTGWSYTWKVKNYDDAQVAVAGEHGYKKYDFTTGKWIMIARYDLDLTLEPFEEMSDVVIGSAPLEPGYYMFGVRYDADDLFHENDLAKEFVLVS